MTWTVSSYYVFLYLACFVVSAYLFQVQVQQHIYLQDCRRHLVAVSQRRNDHMQVYIIIMEDK